VTCAERENTAVGARGRTTVVRACVEEAAYGSIARQLTTKSFAWLLRRPTVRHELSNLRSRDILARLRAVVCVLVGAVLVGAQRAAAWVSWSPSVLQLPVALRIGATRRKGPSARPLAPGAPHRTTTQLLRGRAETVRSRRCSGAKSGAYLGVEHHDGTRSALLRRAPQAPRRGAWHTQPLRARTRRLAVKQLSCSHACTRPHPTGTRACLPPLTAP
jgi:hypothetical protein